MSDPKADCETLMASVLPFAEQMLNTYGEFIPYGGAMRVSVELVPVAGYDGSEHPISKDIIQLIKDGLVDGAQKGQFKATALVYDVRVALPPTGEESNAIAVSLNHKDEYSIVVLFPYKIENGKFTLDVVMAQKGEADIFPQP